MRVFLILLAISIGMPPPNLCASEPVIKEIALAREILSDTDLPIVFDKAEKLLVTGLNAGSGYGEVWIRDLNTFIELSLEVNDNEIIREALLMFFKFQGDGGDIVDGYIPKDRANVGYQYRRSALVPELLAHKNTVETDQESSLVQAVYKYVTVTGDRLFLSENVDGTPVIKRLGQALDYLLTERFDEEHSLVWGATTVDWGDVQPEHIWGVELDANSHRAIDIYDNAMFAIALDNYVHLLGSGSHETARWSRVRNALKRAVRAYLWDGKREKFIPHLYLGDSPFPSDVDEKEIFYHGGTAIAIEAGFLTRDETAQALRQMIKNVDAAGAGSIGLTVFPPYPAGTFKNRGMGPYSYQNGGDWCWFGGRMIQQLIRHDLIHEAYRELKPMVTRVVQHGDFYEWWSLDNQPRGSPRFRGSAGVLGKAIKMLLAWADTNKGSRETSDKR